MGPGQGTSGSCNISCHLQGDRRGSGSFWSYTISSCQTWPHLTPWPVASRRLSWEAKRLLLLAANDGRSERPYGHTGCPNRPPHGECIGNLTRFSKPIWLTASQVSVDGGDDRLQSGVAGIAPCPYRQKTLGSGRHPD
jgi:hypothetical protein